MKRIYILVVICIAAFQLQAAVPDTAITIDGNISGMRFDGVGAISAGASSRLLYDYPEPERSQILDYLFKPDYGASMQLLKVEIGGDMNSTDGSEPSHEHGPDDLDCGRGYEWWLIREAKKRNPDIKLIALAWGAPGWIGKFWSPAMIDYLMDWLDCARSNGITIDYIGGWNERGWNADWYIALDSALNKKFPHVKIIAADDVRDPWSVATEMTHNAALKKAVDIVGVHSACGWRTYYTKCPSTADARSLGKPLWNSEHSSLSHNVGALPLARAMNRLYIEGKITGNMCWSLVSAWYASFPIADTGPLLAEWPWSGHYEVGKSIWVYAHTAQFTRPGWHYMDKACGFLPSGASFVTLRSPDRSEFTTIIEAVDAKTPQQITFSLKGRLSDKPVHVWETNLLSGRAEDYFNHVKDVRPLNGVVKIKIQPGCLYTLSTTSGQHKGSAASKSGIDAQMPLPFKEDFEGYQTGKLARYFSDVNGAFETASCDGGTQGLCYEQMGTGEPVTWIDRGMPPATILGDPRWWGDYKVSVDVYLPQKGYVELLGRVCAQEGLSIAGYHLRVNTNGDWKLYSEGFRKKDSTLLEGSTAFTVKKWHKLGLEMHGSRIRIWIDHKSVGSVDNKDYITGQIGLLVSPWQKAQFDNVVIRKTGDWPHFINKKNMRAWASSAHAANYKGYDYVAAHAVDDRPETIWHSEWEPKAALPQSLTIDMGRLYQVEGLVCQPRLDGTDKGMITTCNVYISKDGTHFKKVDSGKWHPSPGSKAIQFAHKMQARYIKVEATAGIAHMAAVGEISIMEAPAL
ncbi:MAG TPA: discoidin domain-containing protein [Chitinophagaceae bacterium]|nr:discoidin domain-containing protein [Chitinophagaceae bacterium]